MMMDNETKITALPRKLSSEETDLTIPACASGNFQIENAVDKESRLVREDLDAKDGRIRKQALFFTVLAMYAVTFVFCGACCLSTDPNISTWARTIFAGMLLAVSSFLIGKEAKSH